MSKADAKNQPPLETERESAIQRLHHLQRTGYEGFGFGRHVCRGHM